MKNKTIDLKADWFSNWFDSPYYHILYKHRDWVEAQFFIDKLSDFFHFKPGHKILDIACGRGRHAIYLNQKGLNVVGIDLSEKNIGFAKKFENKLLRFYTQDMREPFAECCFDFILNLFTSFGYFETDEEDLQALRAAKINLSPKGKLIIDFLNPVQVIENIQAFELKKVEGIQFQIRKKTEGEFIIKNISFEDKGITYQFEEKVKAISLEKFLRFFQEAGLSLLHTFGDYHLGSFSEKESERMIFVLENK